MIVPLWAGDTSAAVMPSSLGSATQSSAVCPGQASTHPPDDRPRPPPPTATDVGEATRDENLMAVDLQSVTTQPRCVPTEVRRAPQSQMCRRGLSWMVQLYIRLLTGRFQVRILVAEPAELEIDGF
jgi:hypothetical protein